MALRKIGKIWHAYYRNENGSLVTRSTGCSDKREAEKTERILMKEARVARARHRLGLAATIHAASTPRPGRPHRRHLKLADALDAAGKYKTIGNTTAKAWRRFIAVLPCKYIDEITSDLAYAYLQEKYGGEERGKSYNNNRSSLNAVINLVRMDAGIERSPFEIVPTRQFETRGYRPLSVQEFEKVFAASDLLWQTAELIGWHTGLRESDCHAVGPAHIKDGGIYRLPDKTRRFGRRVWIPIKQQLQQWLDMLPPSLDDRFCGFVPDTRGTNAFKDYFGELLRDLEIKDNEDGIVGFPSIRKAFVTRCDEADIPRHATRGMVGHVDNDQTDDYSFDRVSARKILELPDPDIQMLKCM